MVPVRQAFAGSVQTLQALCGDCHSEKTLRESAQPTSLESRVAPGVMEYVRAPRMEAERPKQRRWNGVDDPISHCLAGNSLLLTGLPGTGKTHLARTIVARLREQGEAVHLVSKTHCSAQNLGLGAQTADHWVRRYVRGGSAQKLDWLVVEEITQLDMALWAGRGEACASPAAAARRGRTAGTSGPRSGGRG